MMRPIPVVLLAALLSVFPSLSGAQNGRKVTILPGLLLKDSGIYLYDRQTHAHGQATPLTVAFSSDSRLVAAGGVSFGPADGSPPGTPPNYHVWDAATGEIIFAGGIGKEGASYKAHMFGFWTDSRSLVVDGMENNGICIWDIDANRKVRNLKDDSAILPQDPWKVEFIYRNYHQMGANVIDRRSQRHVATLPRFQKSGGQNAEIYWAEPYAARGQILCYYKVASQNYAGRQYGALYLFTPSGNRWTRMREFGHYLYSQFNSDRTQLVCQQEVDRRQFEIIVLDAATCKMVARPNISAPYPVPFTFCAAHFLAASSTPETVTVWDTRTWQPVGSISNQEHHFGPLAFAPDGKTLAAIVENEINPRGLPLPTTCVRLYRLTDSE